MVQYLQPVPVETSPARELGVDIEGSGKACE
jgi:hypothetical protein